MPATNDDRPRCSVCREPSDELIQQQRVVRGRNVRGKPTCPRCIGILNAPPCRNCGRPVRGALIGDPEPYHERCRRCTSCYQIVAQEDVVKLAGCLLCKACDGIFGKFFMPTRRPELDRVRESFKAWDTDNSGFIDADELRRVLKALDPNFAETDLDKIIRIIDKNRNRVIEYDEFCEWISQGSPISLGEESFEHYVSGLMKEAAMARSQSGMEIAEIHLIPSVGVNFVLRNGHSTTETTAVIADELELALIEIEEFISMVEFTESGLTLVMNTGRMCVVGGHGDTFGPFTAPEGFCIVGLRTKPCQEDDELDRVVGVDLAPLPNAKAYEAASALRFASEVGFLQTLRNLLSKGVVDVNSSGHGQVTALMLAAQNGHAFAVRYLLSSKANPHLTDSEGWTALTYASRFGHTQAVDLLAEMSSKGKAPGGGSALREALRNQHNNAARALLRAGFGPAAKGTFSLEESRDTDEKCRLFPPIVKPRGGAYSYRQGQGRFRVVMECQDVDVSLFSRLEDDASVLEDEAVPETAEEQMEEDLSPDLPIMHADTMASTALFSASLASTSDKMEILYTVDGRDPLKAGRRYRGPISLIGDRVHLRAVAVKAGYYSSVVDEVYIMCHYAIPDEVITGSVVITSIPQVRHILERAIGYTIDEQPERIHIHDVHPVESCRKVWLIAQLRDIRPRHQFVIDRSFATIRGTKKNAEFVNRFIKDVQNACGIAPIDVQAIPDRSTESVHKAGGILVEFSLPRERAEGLAEQINDMSSFLLSRAHLRDLYADANVTVVQPLAERLQESTLRTRVFDTVNKRVSVDEVIGIGHADEGHIAIMVPKAAAKDAERFFRNGIAQAFPESEVVGAIEASIGDLTCTYSVDVVSGMRPDRGTVDGGTFVQALTQSDFDFNLMQQMSAMQCSATIKTVDRAVARELSELEFHLQWSFPVSESRASVSSVRKFLDGMCLVYSGTHCITTIDFRSMTANPAEEQPSRLLRLNSKMTRELQTSVGAAIQHCGDELHETGAEQHMRLNLNALPNGVTDIFLCLAAYQCDDLSAFPNPTVEIHDVANDFRMLSEFSIESAGNSQAVVMCSITRDPDHRKWVIHGLGTPCSGGVHDYAPIKEVIADRQAGYQRWERRSHMIKFKMLRRHDRIKEHSCSEFAKFVWRLLDLPDVIFQTVVMWL